MNEISALIRVRRKFAFPLCFPPGQDTRNQQSSNQKRTSPEFDHPNLRLPASRTVIYKFLYDTLLQ